MDSFRRLADGMLQVLQLDFIEVGEGEHDIAVLSLGAGMLMATVDHLSHCYPGIRWLCADLPGYWTTDRRAMVIDYAATAYPCILVLWHSLKSGVGLAEAVQERNCHPRDLWVYVQGIGRDETVEIWREIGAREISCLFVRDPLTLVGAGSYLGDRNS